MSSQDLSQAPLMRSITNSGSAAVDNYAKPPSDSKNAMPLVNRQTSQDRRDIFYRISHEVDAATIFKLWNQLESAEHKKQAVLDHFKVSTQTTRQLNEEDCETLLRIDRAITKKLSAYDEKDIQFMQRYKDIAKSLPPDYGGVWMLIRRIEEKLSEDILGNLWQDSIIYGLIGGTEAAQLLQCNRLLLRFSLTECCLCSTLRNNKNQVMHNLFPEGLTEAASLRFANYQLTTRASQSLMPFSEVYATYSDPAKKEKRISDYSHWHNAHYGVADESMFDLPASDSNSSDNIDKSQTGSVSTNRSVEVKADVKQPASKYNEDVQSGTNVKPQQQQQQQNSLYTVELSPSKTNVKSDQKTTTSAEAKPVEQCEANIDSTVNQQVQVQVDKARTIVKTEYGAPPDVFAQ